MVFSKWYELFESVYRDEVDIIVAKEKGISIEQLFSISYYGKDWDEMAQDL